MSVWPVLKSLPEIGVPVFLARAMRAGMSAERFGRAVGVGDALLDRRVRVDHRGQDVGVALLQAALELLDRGVHVGGLAVDLGGAAPHHHQPAQAVLLLELLDVGDDLVGEVALVLALLDVLPVQLLHVHGIEDGRPGLDRLQEALQRLQVLVVEHARLARRPRRRCRCRRPSPPKTTSSSFAIGTSSSMRGLRLSVRLPRRTVPIWVRLPTGLDRPLRIASTPAMNVVATAPMPGEKDAQLAVRGSDARAPGSCPWS